MNKQVSTAVVGLLFLAGASIAAADTLVLTPSGFSLSVGATLPSTVEVHTLDVPKVKTKYDYVVIGKQTVLVEPGTRKVVQVLD